ncbi:hypothetical protein N302_07302, partial [Corvus brachyrhynchos]
EVIGPGGEAMRVKVPFSTSDLNIWREEVRNYREDPKKVAKRFELIVRNQDPDWGDVDLMLSELTETKKELVIKTAKAHVERQISSGALQGTVEQAFPTSNPRWNPNDERDYALLVKYRNLVKIGLENAIPKAVNWSMIFQVKQECRESPTAFVD